MTQLETEGRKPEATDGKLSKVEAQCDANVKAKPTFKAKTKPLTNTLDRWFKPAVDATKLQEASINTIHPASLDHAKNDTKIIEQKLAKPVSASRNFVQRYIHLNDECRVCKSAKTEEAARCELRCATCSMTVHKKCYEVKGEVSNTDWNCRRCQFIYDETAWEDISSLIGMAEPTEVTFPLCKPLDDKQKLHQMFTSCDFAAVFLFLQRFRRLGLKLSSVVITLESLANALIEPKEDKLCEELHTRLLANTNVVIKKGPWHVQLMHFLREEEYPPAMTEETMDPGDSGKAEERKDFYFELPLTERVAMLKFLCEAQFDRNDILVEQIEREEAESMRNKPIGTDAAGRSYFTLEDAATVPNAAVWVCRCTKDGGTDWETVCNDLESVESLVQQLSLSVHSAELQLWQVLSRGVLKKLTRQQEKRRRNERRKYDLGSSEVLESSVRAGDWGRRSLRHRQQVNYASLDAAGEEEEDIVANSDESGYEDESSTAKSDDNAASDRKVGNDDDEGESRLRQRSRNSNALVKRRMNDHRSTRNCKRRRHSPPHHYLRRSMRHHDGNPTASISCNQEIANDDCDPIAALRSDK